ncbi:MAG: ornithine cyclodeaminase family protein, partial [Bacteroidetes bacterium]|nr:ornithine cyclodeaminase family protein [Bacteroidota bacterium]
SIGVTIINDPETLIPLAVMDAGFITTMRTAGMAAIGAKYLAKKESKVLAIIGCGRQARTHLEAFLKLDRFKFEEVRIFDINENAMEVYKNDMEKNFGVPIKKMTSVESAVKEADIVCSVTSFRDPIIFDEWLKPGSHLAATCLYDVDIKHVLPNADKWVLGNTERDRRWFETEEAKRKFNLSIDQIYGDLSEIVCGKKQGRQDEKERTNMTHLGMGAMDVACAFKAYEKVKKQNFRTKLSLFGGSVL